MNRLASSRPSIAVVGGGLSGCLTARLLAEEGANVHIFEAARGLGGRAATRRVQSPYLNENSTLFFDHGLPGLYASHNPSSPSSHKFTDLLKSWEKVGFVERWDAPVFTLSGQTLTAVAAANGAWYAAVPQGNSLCSRLADHASIKQRIQTRVVSLQQSSDTASRQLQWSLGVRASDGTPNVLEAELFDGVVVSDKQAVSAYSMRQFGELPLLDNPQLPLGVLNLASAMKTVGQVPRFTLMMAFKAPTPPEGHAALNFGRIFVTDNGIIESISNESSKPQRAKTITSDYVCIVANATEAYAVDRIGAQLTVKGSGRHENLLENVCDEMHEELTRIYPALKSLEPAYKVAHRWGACFPQNATDELESLVAKGNKFGVCGDWIAADAAGKQQGERDNQYIRNAVTSAHRVVEEMVGEFAAPEAKAKL